jgi:Mannosylglycerate hydrolase MGH1-like glycoside hydrolase domain
MTRRGWISAEAQRLEELRHGKHWRRWGPYLSERQWGTVREDYSEYGNAWEYLPHDHARSRAYRWGEDGIGGFGDDRLLLCLGLALWNGRDPILKERLFGLTNLEGNHGEDVKELYYYLDGTPTHSYMRMLYKYPQAAFPYNLLVEENRCRGRSDPEFELIDTGVFADNRYFDIEIEYAKADTDDILLLVTIHNRGSEAAELHVLPQLWARNTWSWRPDPMRPQFVAREDHSISVDHPQLPQMRLHCDDRPEFLFCQNETNVRRLWGIDAPGHHFKDGINDYVVNGDTDAVRPDRRGSKVAAHYRLSLSPHGTARLRTRLTLADNPSGLGDFDRIVDQRRADADEFYAELQQDIASPDARLVQRQALAGMLWSKQFYYIDIPEWLNGDPLQPPPPAARRYRRNSDWPHLNNADIVAMPDKWEYPWYAAWDLAFHAVTLALIDPGFAKSQLLLLTRDWYMHPNGQLPAYEWAFGDVNPPVHAWAAWRVYEIDRDHRGEGDYDFLERVFHKLMLNFTWWVNRKDVEGRNIFQGGFLGLDNIGIFDRNAALPSGGHINQADGTAWMAMYTLNLMRIALELALTDHVYEDIASKFFEHFLYIAEAMTNIGGDGIGLWDDEDEFYYDVLHLPDGERIPLRVRSLVGLIPLFAVEVLDAAVFTRLRRFSARTHWFLEHRPQLARLVSRWHDARTGERHLLSLLRGHRMKRLLNRMLDETAFLSDFGVRSLSKFYGENPYVFERAGQRFTISYVPGDSATAVFGGNSNWRGPIWMPVNFLLIESLRRFHSYYGDDFKIECPVGSGTLLHLGEVAAELSRRLCRIFLRGKDGRRPIFGDSPMQQDDPNFRDNVLFYEFFHGDDGRGLGASHQTGWTGLVALLIRDCFATNRATETPAPAEAAVG